VYTDTLELDLSTVVPSLAGPKRPQDRIPLTGVKASYQASLKAQLATQNTAKDAMKPAAVAVMEGEGPVHQASVTCKHRGETFDLTHGAVVIAAITSCTNTSNPSVMLMAGLVAQKAVARGLKSKPWVKTSMAPGSTVAKKDFNSYGARRGNHEVMMRGTFANIRLKNELTPGMEGWWTRMAPDAEPSSFFDASVAYRTAGTPLVIIAGKEYGTGSSRDWAAKGTMLLGVRAVIAESFERIHRSNLVGMGVIPCEFVNGETRQSLGLTGFETISIEGMSDTMTPRSALTVKAVGADGAAKRFQVRSRIDTPEEMNYYKHGGILPYVLRNLAK